MFALGVVSAVYIIACALFTLSGFSFKAHPVASVAILSALYAFTYFTVYIGQMKAAYGYYKANSKSNPDTSYDYPYATDLLAPALRALPTAAIAAVLMSVPVSFVSYVMHFVLNIEGAAPYVILNIANFIFLLLTTPFVMAEIALERRGVWGAFGASVKMTLKNIHSIIVCAIVGGVIIFLIMLVLGIVVFLLKGLLTAALMSLMFSLSKTGPLALYAAGLVAALIVFGINTAVQQLSVSFYAVLYAQLIELEYNKKLEELERRDGLKFKTTTHQIEQSVQDRILAQLDNGSPANMNVGDVLSMNEGENKKEHSFYHEVQVEATPSDEMPTLVFDINSAEARELLKTNPGLAARLKDDLEDSAESTIVASLEELKIERDGMEEKPIPKHIITPPPPPPGPRK